MKRFGCTPRVVWAAALVLGASSAGAQAKPPPAPAPIVPPPAPAPIVPPREGEPALGSYVSARINGKAPPMTDRATDEGGVQYLIEFDELILSIQANHQFRAALRYRQTLAAKGDKIGQDPIKKMTVYGAWSAIGSALHFVPDPKRGGSGLQILSGSFSGTRIDVPFDYRNGTVSRRATVVLMRNANIF